MACGSDTRSRTHDDRQVYLLMHRYLRLDRRLLLHSDLWDEYVGFCTSLGAEPNARSPLGEIVYSAQEAVLEAPWVYLAVRPQAGRWCYLRFHVEAMEHEEVPVREFLGFKERLVNGLRKAGLK